MCTYVASISVFKTAHHFLDTNECMSGDSDPCGDNAECVDTFGSFICNCSEGFAGDGVDCKSWSIFY